MDSYRFRRFKLLFQAFGFEPFEKNVKLTKIWLCFHAIFALIQFVIVTKHRDVILYTTDFVGEAGDNVKFCLNFSTYFVAIYVSWNSHACRASISNKIKTLEFLIEKLYVNVNDVHEKCCKSFKKKFVLMITVHLIRLAQAFISQSNETQTNRYIMAFTFPIIVCYFKQLHSIFFIDMLNNYFTILNDQLQQTKELIKVNESHLFNKNYYKFLLKRIKLLRSFHAILYNLKELENKRTEQFYFINQINFYVNILSSLYWITFRFFNQRISFSMSK